MDLRGFSVCCPFDSGCRCLSNASDEWIRHVKHIDSETWFKMSKEDKEKILEEYKRLCWEEVERRKAEKLRRK